MISKRTDSIQGTLKFTKTQAQRINKIQFSVMDQQMSTVKIILDLYNHGSTIF